MSAKKLTKVVENPSKGDESGWSIEEKFVDGKSKTPSRKKIKTHELLDNLDETKLYDSTGEVNPDEKSVTYKPAHTIEEITARFEQDRNDLLMHHKRKWVAYSIFGEKRFADTQTLLYKYFLNELGYKHNQFIVRHIVEATSDIAEYSLEK